ncbi:hypothetical protein BACCIP111883_04525 [Sutcliffiella rhizosphaerae]|uniref:NADH dehydrogenase subunit 3 n=1 Tax=Sutcliffiella rhizosphaerae TaxID=2880967 RepID=A0ABN8AKM3_9BACI|nr:hypothetical protein BACCIP111883_04525 [Sutcliffiella rhizosphaerae]
MVMVFIGATVVTYSILMKMILQQTCEPKSVE